MTLTQWMCAGLLLAFAFFAAWRMVRKDREL